MGKIKNQEVIFGRFEFLNIEYKVPQIFQTRILLTTYKPEKIFALVDTYLDTFSLKLYFEGKTISHKPSKEFYDSEVFQTLVAELKQKVSRELNLMIGLDNIELSGATGNNFLAEELHMKAVNVINKY